jgi:glucosamine--fructose-6-phosphate aminotransferase (isomerizing)
MCGIVGAIAERDIIPILMEGLRRLEYRGYDSAGIAVRGTGGALHRIRALGKVSMLQELLDTHPLQAPLGIAHTRWATHGMPAERNAHPHMSGEVVAVVHNGIIENHAELRAELESAGIRFTSETDTEVVAHLLGSTLATNPDLLSAVRAVTGRLVGAFALAVCSPHEPDRLVVARVGSPLVIGLGIGENFVASDVFALLPVTQRFVFLEEGDLADVRRDGISVIDQHGRPAQRRVRQSHLAAASADKGSYAHYMLKEIHEQPAVIAETLEGRIHKGRLLEASFGPDAGKLLDRTRSVHIVACGTSYHAGLVARYWLEEIGIHCVVDVASEFRYRRVVVPDNTLFVTISQSGETADTLAALRASRSLGYLAGLGICNVPESTLVRESDVTLMTRAGPEIGAASTKAFTTQLVAL